MSHALRIGRGKRSGFSLIEVIVALAVLAIALTGIIGTVLHMMTSRQLEKDLNTARDAAMSQIDRTRALNYVQNQTTLAQIQAAYSAGGVFNSPNFAVPGLRNDAYNNICGTVTWDGTNPEIVRLIVTITWRSLKGVRTFSTWALITR